MTEAQELVKHTATLEWVDKDSVGHREQHAAWTARLAATKAYRRARSMMTSGQAVAYRMTHTQQVIVT